MMVETITKKAITTIITRELLPENIRLGSVIKQDKIVAFISSLEKVMETKIRLVKR